MDLAPPPLDAAPSPEPSPDPEPVVERPPDRILGGVAALLSERLDVDALWIRIGFVLLALVGGVGLLVYAAMWLAFVVGAERYWARIAGGVLLIGGLPLLLHGRGDRLLTGPWAVLALLAGLTLALWQPRRDIARRTAGTGVPDVASSAVPPDAAEAAAAARSPRPAVRLPRSRRPPSILGRATLGIAMLVAAGGAVIDQANGGRLHPEQWLGAAAIVCGIGLLVGAVAGRALWLVVPAVLFAGAGFVAGEAASMDLHPTTVAGDEFIHVGSQTVPGAHLREHVVFGSVDVQIDQRPAQPVTVDAKVGFGEIRIRPAADVTVEVRTRPGDDVRVYGVRRAGGTFTLGPDGQPAVVVDAHVAHGHVAVERYLGALPVPPVIAPTVPTVPIVPDAGQGELTEVTDGVAMSTSGAFVLAGGEAVIGADDQVEVGSHYEQGRVTVIETSAGDFKLLPGGLLATPTDEVLDLHALRGAPDASVQTTTGG
jgi:phage shock protein PspC (stress-responsive transcriptional regulator)